LVEATSLEAYLALLDGRQALYIQKVEPHRAGRYGNYIGKRTNLHCTAVGKVLLAYSRPAFLLGFLQEDVFSRHTEYTLSSSAALRQEVQKIRRLGYALEDEEWSPGVRCLAVPIMQGSSETTSLALGLMGATEQIQHERIPSLARTLKAAASELVQQVALTTRLVQNGEGDQSAAPPSTSVAGTDASLTAKLT
jgi:IclR family acetate operon transcriptional repressor